MPSVTLRLMGDKKLAEELLNLLQPILDKDFWIVMKTYPYYTKKLRLVANKRAIGGLFLARGGDDTKTRIYLRLGKKRKETT